MAEIFTRKFSEVSGGRFDAEFYSKKYAFIDNFFNNKEYKTLKEIVEPIKNGSTPNNGKFEEKGIPYFRSQDLDLYESYPTKFVSLEFHNSIIRSKLAPNDVLLAIVGATLGAVGFVSNDIAEANINQNIAKLRIIDDKIKAKFLAIFLDSALGKKQVFRLATITTQAYINNSQLGLIKIPKLPLSTQQHIIDLMDKAYKAKQEKENKAKELLDSIDSYLLEELGIILPLRANNTLDSRIYTQKISALSGSRFDANYHQKYYTDLEKSLLSSPYPLVNLASLINNFKKGIEVGSGEYSQNKEIPFIRVSDISNNGIDFSNVQKFISASLFENLKAYKPKENELLYSKDGTVGICLEADTSHNYIISGGILRLELKAEVDKDFLCFLLGSYIMNVFANRASIGAVIKHLNVGEFLNLKIPLPPLAIQTQIASRLKSSKFQALSLEKEAKEILHKAKIDIEALLLTAGGGGVTLAFSFEAFKQTHYFDKMIKIWNEKEYSVVRLGEVARVKSGFAFSSKDYVQDSNVSLITIKNIDFSGVVFGNTTFLPNNYWIEYANFQIKNGDILIAMSGSVGKICIYNSNKLALLNQRVGILKIEKCLNDFVVSILQTKIYQHFFARIATGGVQLNLNEKDILNLKIPLPPLTEQERIAKEISQRKARAKALKQEAKESLESAKKKVEHIILGVFER
ncbi:restriction endonuclease subunit S [Campylobacter felis]|uniref:restriction endonuclease subunit S n=1 Tax=Campylobacter felis TaxID=2974565 RepID=UPI00255D35C7|nr:restriction endonuclease subunit S [Campylobacter felis]MDL0110857.1 restriction endonuclease subunit S [Campylobacter felis]